MKLVIPFVAQAQEFVFPFEDFTVASGAGVDLNDIRAAKLTIGSTDRIFGAALDANLVGVLFVAQDALDVSITAAKTLHPSSSASGACA